MTLHNVGFRRTSHSCTRCLADDGVNKFFIIIQDLKCDYNNYEKEPQ